jgi:hypothetical protein
MKLRLDITVLFIIVVRSYMYAIIVSLLVDSGRVSETTVWMLTMGGLVINTRDTMPWLHSQDIVCKGLGLYGCCNECLIRKCGIADVQLKLHWTP